MSDEPEPLSPQAAEAVALAEEPTAGRSLAIWVVVAVVLAIPVGLWLGQPAERLDAWGPTATRALSLLVATLEIIPQMVLRAIGALGAPLVALAILSAIVTNDIHGRQGLRMLLYYLLNTLVAMAIALALANAIQPGKGATLESTASTTIAARLSSSSPKPPAARTATEIVTDLVPTSLARAFVENNLAQIVLVAIAFGIGLTQIRDARRARGDHSYRSAVELLEIGFELLMKVLLWVIRIVPFAVFGVVAMAIGRQGLGLFINLGWFIIAVLLGLSLQIVWYLIQVASIGGIAPLRFLSSASSVVGSTLSTSSTAATIPFTLSALQRKLGITRASSNLAACVGTNFNNDGTALYQAVAVLFFAQALGQPLSLGSQLLVMLITLMASVGAGGIPSGSFVTIPLIFSAVGLPSDQIPILLTIDWFLDRCRTTGNVLGDMTVAVLLDRTEPTRLNPALATLDPPASGSS